MTHFVSTMTNDLHNGMITVNMDGYTTFKGLVAVLHDVAREVRKYDSLLADDLAAVKTAREAREYLQPYISNWENQSYIFEVEPVGCASRWVDDIQEMEYEEGSNYFHILFVIDKPEEMRVVDLLEMAGPEMVDEIKMVCADGYDLGSMSRETAGDMYGARKVQKYDHEYDKKWGLNVLVITLADTWHRDGRPEELEGLDEFDGLTDGTYMVRCYKRSGDLSRTYYANTEERAAEIRTAWAASIGVYPGDREHWALFPTVWKKDQVGEFHRVTKYA